MMCPLSFVLYHTGTNFDGSGTRDEKDNVS
jgi:hypothetical protein